jgi:predicted nucleic acid-binding protein
VILLDVGVWLAAVWARQVHHRTVATWFDQQTESFALCRVTQTSLMRLLSNEAVMAMTRFPGLRHGATSYGQTITWLRLRRQAV